MEVGNSLEITWKWDGSMEKASVWKLYLYILGCIMITVQNS